MVWMCQHIGRDPGHTSHACTTQCFALVPACSGLEAAYRLMCYLHT
jgi:hypothetical protein